MCKNDLEYPESKTSTESLLIWEFLVGHYSIKYTLKENVNDWFLVNVKFKIYQSARSEFNESDKFSNHQDNEVLYISSKTLRQIIAIIAI